MSVRTLLMASLFSLKWKCFGLFLWHNFNGFMEKGLFTKFCGVFISSHEVIKLQIFESGVGDVILANIQNNSFPAVYYGATWHIFKPKLKIKIKYPLKKVLYVLIFWKMEFLALILGSFLYFIKRKVFFYFRKRKPRNRTFL